VATGLIIALSIFRFQLFDLVPVARDTLVEKMLDGILVLDEQSRVVDINPAARRLIGEASDRALGQNIETVLSAWPVYLDQFRNVMDAHVELAIDEESERSYIEVVISPLHNRQGKVTGRLVMLRNITARRLAQDSLQQANEQLKAQLEENEILQAKLREQAIHDALTGTFNRTYLDDTLGRELARAEREASSVSLLMIDIDHFKAVNDTYGHKAGDLMLEALGRLFRGRTRSSDVIFRYGGEEFLALLPGMPLDAAAERAERLREQVATLEVEHEGKSVHITISIGAATYHPGQDADAVLTAADRALYKAKALGRNCVAVEE
jgi:diguanylate cyclase (GGDEF)-like protein/PAS domain S-box-containing protein